MTPEEELQRASEAEQVLENQAFRDAFSQIEEALLSGIRRAAIKDGELREKLMVRYCVLHDLRDQLKTLMEGGKLAAATIEQRNWKERIFNVVGL